MRNMIPIALAVLVALSVVFWPSSEPRQSTAAVHPDIVTSSKQRPPTASAREDRPETLLASADAAAPQHPVQEPARSEFSSHVRVQVVDKRGLPQAGIPVALYRLNHKQWRWFRQSDYSTGNRADPPVGQWTSTQQGEVHIPAALFASPRPPALVLIPLFPQAKVQPLVWEPAAPEPKTARLSVPDYAPFEVQVLDAAGDLRTESVVGVLEATKDVQFGRLRFDCDGTRRNILPRETIRLPIVGVDARLSLWIRDRNDSLTELYFLEGPTEHAQTRVARVQLPALTKVRFRVPIPLGGPAIESVSLWFEHVDGDHSLESADVIDGIAECSWESGAADAGYRRVVIWSDDDPGCGTTLPISLQPRKRLDLGVVPLQRGAGTIVRGSIHDEKNRAIAGARVRFMHGKHEIWRLRTKTDTEGRFSREIPRALLEGLTLQVEANRHRRQTARLGRDQTASITLSRRR